MESQKKPGKNKIVGGALGTLLAVTALAGAALVNHEGVKVEDHATKAEKGYCTVLVYMDGSDLESDYGAATKDLEEMKTAVDAADEKGKDIRVVVEAGGAKKWDFDEMQDKSYGRFCITGQGISDVEEMDIRDMGRSDTLADFINYGIQSYPAKHYGLVFWNHGGGQIEGFGSDENFDYSTLELEEIKEGIECSCFKEPFDFVGMDACLMSSIELVSVLQEKADYLIASEELEPQDGFDYTWMEELAGNDSETAYGQKIGEAILSSYENSYKDEEYSTTLALVDMNQYETFHSTFDEVAQELLKDQSKGDEELFSLLGKLRKSIRSFGAYGGEDTVADKIDLLDFSRVMADNQICSRDLYDKLKTACEQLVIHKVWHGYESEPCGFSIYLPGGKYDVEKDNIIYAGISFCQKYKDFVEDYVTYLTQGEELYWDAPVEKNRCIQLDVPKEQLEEIANAYSVVYTGAKGIDYILTADGDVTLDEKGFLKAPRENTFWGLKGEILCLVENYSTDDMTEYLTPVLYKKAEGEWEQCMMSIVFSDEQPDGTIISIAPPEDTKQVYELEEGDEIIPLYPLADDSQVNEENKDSLYESVRDGKEAKYYYKGKVIWIEDIEQGDDQLERMELSEEPLHYGFLIRDTRMELYYTGYAK